MIGGRPVVALPVLVSGLEAEMIRLGYKDSTMVWYRGAWRRLQRYFAARGVEEFSLDVALEWVDAACGFFAKEQAGTLKQTDVYLFRVAQMLGDYYRRPRTPQRQGPARCRRSTRPSPTSRQPAPASISTVEKAKSSISLLARNRATL
jgi:hypothetical protein